MASAKAVAFLQKKSWHTGTMRSMEKVWQAEERHKQEDRKLAEWRREKEEERELESLRRQQDKALGTERKERLDFLYEIPAGAVEGEFDMNKRYVDPEKHDEVKQLRDKPGALFMQQQEGDSLTDMRAKIRDDPLFQIKQEQQKLKQQIRDNPVKMKELKEQILRQKLKEELKATKKKDKHHKKHKKSKDHKEKTEKDVKPKDVDEKREHRDEQETRVKKEERSPERGERRRSKSPRRSPERVERRRSKSPRRYSPRRDERRRSPPRRSPERYDRRDDRRRSPPRDRYRDERRRSPRRSSSRERRRSPRDDRRRSPRRYSPCRSDRNDFSPERGQKRPRDDIKREDTEPADKKTKVSSSASSSRRMTHEERLRMLEEMEVDGKQQKDDRVQRINLRMEERQKELQETNQMLVEASKGSIVGGPNFLKDVSRTVYEEGSTASVSDRIKRSKHNIQRTNLDSDQNVYRG